MGNEALRFATMLILSRNGQSIRLDARPFDDESALQRYIAANPAAIPIADGPEGARLHVLGREFATECGPIDVVATDSSGGAYLIETKLYKNPDKRMVLSQVLDYGAALWGEKPTVDLILERLRHDAKRRSLTDPLVELASFLNGEEEDARKHLALVCDAMAAGRFTALVLMDRLDERLRNLILFMNENSEFRFLAVELDYYRNGNEEIVSPRVFGNEVRRSSRNGGARGSWTQAEFFERLSENTDSVTVGAIRKLFDFAAPLGPIGWGSGAANPSMNPYFLDTSQRAPITVKVDGQITLKLSWLHDSPVGPIFTATATPMLEALGLEVAGPGNRVFWAAHQWVARVDGVIAAFQSGLEAAAAAR